ncbi:L-rhamnose mutarotase [Maribacter arcticus]|nr:L-rhamnose mutarotase [Maribacter arcticus]|tara:strand:+ start:5000 stop:5113 length:114 start_codon:yes stop_codon:yes gene_type:complete
MKTERLCFALDLKDDSRLIQQYIAHHKKVWPGIIASI